MYINFFKYHVQDRDYSSAEVLELMNNSVNKHHLLSGGKHFYSNGSAAETIIGMAASAGEFIASIPTLGLAYAVTNFFKKALNHEKYNITELDGDFFKGYEVVQFLNEYYDYHIFGFNANVGYNNSIDKLINHKYSPYDIPTSENSYLFDWDCAVLDVDETVSTVKHVDIYSSYL